MTDQPQAQPVVQPVAVPQVVTQAQPLPKEKNRIWIFVIVIAMLASAAILYTLKATWGTIIGFIVVTLASIILIYWFITKVIERSRDDTEENAIVIINNKKAKEIIDNYAHEQGILKEQVLCSHSYIVKPEMPEQTPSYFFYTLMQDACDKRFYMVYINKKNVEDIGIVWKNRMFEKADIKEVLDDAAESTREYIPITKETVDSMGRTINIETTMSKPVYRFPKKEATIGD